MKTWVTKSTRLSDGSRMTTRMSSGEYLMGGCLGVVFKGVWWFLRLCLYGWIVWPIRYFIRKKRGE